MAYPHKWSPISCRSSAGQGKFAGQRPTFYHCATPPYSCYIGLLAYCTIYSYTGFAAHDNAYDVILGLHHNAVSPAALFSAAPTATDDNDFLDFSHHIFFMNIFVLL